MSKINLSHPTFNLTADGSPQYANVSGPFLLCDYADDEFELSIDGGTFVPFNQGLRITNLSVPKIWVRAVNGADIAISFYVGGVEIDDSRLNIIHDENQILSVGSKVPATYMLCGNANIAAGATQVINGGNAGNQRKDIYIFNLDAVQTLAVASNAGIIGGIVAPADNLPLETSDTVKIINQNGAAVAACWLEIYYAA